MNRTIALFVALVILLAHCLAIHSDGQGHFAFPYEQAYVPLRLAHNFIFEGQLRWNPGTSAWESYDSPLWVAIAAVVERVAASRIGDQLEISTNVLVQGMSIAGALGTVILAAQIRGDRVAGLIAPLLLVSCGSFAAAAANGLETSTFAFFVTASFWAFESRFSNRLAIAMVLLCLTRPEGAYVVAGLFLLRGFAFARGAPRPAVGPFLAPAVAIAATTYARFRATGYVLPPSTHALLHPFPGQIADGIAWLGDAVLTVISLALLVYAVVFLARKKLSGTGMRALLLALLLVAVTVPAGRGPLPFGESLVPVLPLAFIAVQEGLIESLDGTSALGRRLALTSLFACLIVTALVSRHPADLGPLPLERWHARWMRFRGSSSSAEAQHLGRVGLEEEIDRTLRLRGLGVFLRDFLDPGTTVMTSMPGAVGYISRLRTYDLLGRASAVAGKERPAAWTRMERSDVVSALAMEPDFVIPSARAASRSPTLQGIAEEWHADYDDRPGVPGRLGAIQEALSRFEMVVVPIWLAPRGSAPQRSEPFHLLRNRSLVQRPTLAIVREGNEFCVQVRHRSHMQIVDLSLRVVDDRGRSRSFRPTGDLAADEHVLARPGLLVYDSGTRPIELFRGPLPAGADGSRPVELRAVLRNPGASGKDAFAEACEEATLRL